MNQEIFIQKLLDNSDEIECIQQEVEETIDLVAKKHIKIKKLRRRVRRLKKQKNIGFRRMLRAVRWRINRKFESIFTRSEKPVLHFTGVSVIIPTYKMNPYIEEAVSSVLNQRDKNISVEVVIGVNGSDEAYYEKLKARYEQEARVCVCYTEKAGVSAGRNEALRHIKYSHVMFLDDDDTYTDGYISEMVKRLDGNTDLVCGRYLDVRVTSEEDNYINETISRFNQAGMKGRCYAYSGLFGNVTGKLFSAEQLLTVFKPFNESLKNVEDVFFWAENYRYIKGQIHCFDDDVKEFYVRRVLEDSLSNPTEENEYECWVEDRITIIRLLEEQFLSSDLDQDAKELILRFIVSQNSFLYDYYERASEEQRQRIREAVKEYDGFYLKKMLYSDKKGIAFCYYFPPTSDTSAYVAPKRLRQINEREGVDIDWTVITKDTTGVKEQDMQFKRYFADFICSKWLKVGGTLAFAVKPQFQFAKRAMFRAKEMQADVIYSRSMAPASHLAAYLYKKSHPDVVWYAEFSDPIAMTTDFESRKEVMPNKCKGDEEYLNELYDMCERVVYEAADHIIFTNEIQKDYMISYNPQKELEERILEKSLVWRHPVMEHRMANMGNVCYNKLDPSKINVGYFGRFYPNRSFDDMLALLKNEKVVIHIFAMNEKEIKDLEGKRVKVNKAQPYLNFLKLASMMDYVFLNDMKSVTGIIPWLPSKLSDYLASGAKIIGKYIDGSPMSLIEDEQLIKVKQITKEFAMSLEKREDL